MQTNVTKNNKRKINRKNKKDKKQKVYQIEQEVKDEIIWERGYKAVRFDFTSEINNFQFKLGQTYCHQDKDGNDLPIELCANGFHFCQQLMHVFEVENYDIRRNKKTRYCLIEYDAREGKVIHQNDGKKSVTSTIRFVKELSENEIKRFVPTEFHVQRHIETKLFHNYNDDKPAVIKIRNGYKSHIWYINGQNRRDKAFYY
jgi:hypothetical protein